MRHAKHWGRMHAWVEWAAWHLAVVCLIGSAPLAAQVAERPTWHAGDAWTLEKTDLRRGGSTEWTRTIVKALDSGGYEMSVANRTFQTDANGQEEPKDGPEYKGKWWRWPLRVGDKWEFELPIRMEAGNGKQVVTRQVEGFERIKVPAGEFDCFRISATRTRMTYDARRMARPSYSSVTRYKTWYCPAIRFIAREEEEWVDGYGGLERSESVLASYHLSDQ